MSDEIRKYIYREAIGSGVSNAVINGYIAWLIVKERNVLFMWGAEGFGFDILATAFFLSFIVALIVIPLSRRKVSKGKVASIDWNSEVRLHRLLQRLPEGLGMRALIFGVTGLCLVAPLTLLSLFFLDIMSLAPLQFAIAKGVWAGLLAGTIVIPMILLGIAKGQSEVVSFPVT